MDVKQLSHVEIKDADRGEVSAVIATFNTIDSDGDVTLPGAFNGNGEFPISAYGHASWTTGVPVGKARVRSTANEAIIDGKFFLDSQVARDTWIAVKELGALGQWSYGYDPVDADRGQFEGKSVRFLKGLKVHEASPVLVGAGVNTRTLAAKGRGMDVPADTDEKIEYKAAIRPHTTASTAREWDASAVVSAIPDDASVSDLRSVFAWVDSNGDPEVKSSYKFPHHHGVGGIANIRACLAGIAALNGARGGTDIPESDRKAVYNHLAGHLREADREPPELRSSDDGQLKLHEEAFEVLGGMSDYLESVKRVVALRAQKGKGLSQINLEALDWVGEGIERLASEHKALARRLRDTPREAVAEEFVRYLQMQRRAS